MMECSPTMNQALHQQRQAGRFAWFAAVLLVTVIAARLFYIVYSPRTNPAVLNSVAEMSLPNGPVVRGPVFDVYHCLLVSSDAAGKRIFSGSASQRRALSHLIGDGHYVIGADALYRNELMGLAGDGSYQAIMDRLQTGGSGLDLTLSINVNVQNRASELMRAAGKKGALIVYNYKRGSIVAAVSMPDFDPLQAEAAASQAATDPDLDGVFVNRAFQATYAPASTFKLVTGAALLDQFAGRVDIVNCQGQIHFAADEVLNCTGTHGQLTLLEAIAHSCNIYFGTIANTLDPKRFQATVDDFRMNSRITIDRWQTAQGQAQVAGKSGLKTAQSAIGTDTVQVTPLHLALATAAIADDGVMMRPYLVARLTDAATSQAVYQVEAEALGQPLTKEHADILAKGMAEAVREGTCQGLQIAGIPLRAKSGTAVVENGNQPTAWLVGFIDDPKHPYVVVCVLEDAGSGSKAAVPVARDIFSCLLA